MRSRTCALFLPLVAAVLVVGSTGCGKKNERPDGAVAEQSGPATVDPVDLDAVDAQTLESTPCGNPDWSKLPPQSNAEPR